MTFLDSSQSSTQAASALKFACHPSKVTSSTADPGKLTLCSPIRVSFPDCVYQPIGSLITPTLLAERQD